MHVFILPPAALSPVLIADTIFLDCVIRTTILHLIGGQKKREKKHNMTLRLTRFNPFGIIDWVLCDDCKDYKFAMCSDCGTLESCNTNYHFEKK